MVELIEKTKEEISINDRATLKHMISNSQLGAKSTGIPWFQPSAHRIILHIVNEKDIPELLTINKLTNEEGDWPIVCQRAQGNPCLSCLGFIKILPSVKDERIKANLIREGNNNIIAVSRIKKYRGETFCVKLQFSGHTRPPTVIYDGYDKIVHPYIPPAYLLLCHKCGKGGHKIDQCKSRLPKYPICSQEHERKDCLKTSRKCPNCEGDQNHSPTYHKCPYLS
ncbi:unnamed protein product, partial [Meganyctiphanes norvegica]